MPDLRVKHDLITVVQGTVECYLCRRAVPIKEAWSAVHEWSSIRLFAHGDCIRNDPERALRVFAKRTERVLRANA